MPSEIKWCDAFEKVSEVVGNFLIVCPLIKALTHNSMRRVLFLPPCCASLSLSTGRLWPHKAKTRTRAQSHLGALLPRPPSGFCPFCRCALSWPLSRRPRHWDTLMTELEKIFVAPYRDNTAPLSNILMLNLSDHVELVEVPPATTPNGACPRAPVHLPMRPPTRARRM